MDSIDPRTLVVRQQTGTVSIKFLDGFTHVYGPHGIYIGSAKLQFSDQPLAPVTLGRMHDATVLADAVDTALHMDLPAEVLEVLRPALERWDGVTTDGEDE